MARVDKDSLLASAHGAVGNIVIVHHKGKVWSRSRPRVAPKSTPRRKAHRRKLRSASQWAGQLPKGAPEVAARYREAANGTDWTWQQVAIADYLHGPVIDEVDVSGYTGLLGERIGVQARDGVKPPMVLGVREVRVVIRDLAGKALEQGAAVLDGSVWAYTSQTQVPPAQIVNIEVMATDQPGNYVTRTVPHLTRSS